jgi:hypothetical protein
MDQHDRAMAFAGGLELAVMQPAAGEGYEGAFGRVEPGDLGAEPFGSQHQAASDEKDENEQRADQHASLTLPHRFGFARIQDVRRFRRRVRRLRSPAIRPRS